MFSKKKNAFFYLFLFLRRIFIFIIHILSLTLAKDITKREKRPPYKFKSGAIYEGEWLNGARDGFGTHIWVDGAKYIGE